MEEAERRVMEKKEVEFLKFELKGFDLIAIRDYLANPKSASKWWEAELRHIKSELDELTKGRR